MESALLPKVLAARNMRPKPEWAEDELRPVM